MNHLQRLLPSLRTGDPGDIRGRFALRLTILVDLPEKLRAIKIDPEPPRGPREFWKQSSTECFRHLGSARCGR